MLFAIFTWSPTTVTLALAGAYVGCGAVVAGLLGRRGASPETALSALAVWPLLLPMLSSPLPSPSGPHAPRIEAAFEALRSVVAEVGQSAVDPGDLAGLQAALHRADERVALVDRWIARERSAGGSVEPLQEARARAASEIEAVLQGIAQLRMQIGLLTLAGDGGAVQEQLRGLQARMAALEEVGS